MQFARFFCLFFLFFSFSPVLGILAKPLDFSAIRLGNAPSAVLVVGGIQGDEPGGFSAATLLATRYEILEGSLIVVPNLNFPSIIRRSRGLYGDMNRKFAHINDTDPEYQTVKKIQELINSPEVSLILNLHDGSGFYRPDNIDKLHNKNRWGQSIIIDQEKLDDKIRFNNLETEAKRVAEKTNQNLLNPGHAIHIHNTNTAQGDKEMEKSLSYFAVRNNKAAFGLEASKELPLAIRTYYHLHMIEEFLNIAGINFCRDFELTPTEVEKALYQHLGVSFAENRIFLPLENARKSINFLPLTPDGLEQAIIAKPIMAVLPCEKNQTDICVHFGNRIIALIKPEWLEADNSIDGLHTQIDGRARFASFGQILDVEKEIVINNLAGYRVNAIGLDKGLTNESGIPLQLKDFQKKFSVDRQGLMYRIEVYRNDKFSGMFIVRFAKNGKINQKKDSLNTQVAS